MQLSVLTYNIHKGFTSGNSAFVLPRIRELLREADVDLVFLQEVLGEHAVHAKRISNWPSASQFEFLADQVWRHHAYGKNAILDNSHHGNAILSKHPFNAWANINVSLFQKASRSLLHGTVQVPGTTKRLHVLCVHLGLFGFERKGQIRTLNRHLAEIREHHEAMIIAGDFNDWTSRDVSRHLDPALGLNEAFMQTHQSHARTFPARWPMLCVDRIYYCGLELVSCQCLNGKHWQELSDHVPLQATFELE